MSKKNLDKLKELALTDFQKFVKLTGGSVTQGLICLDRMENELSYNQLSVKYKTPRSTIRDICNKCAEISHTYTENTADE